jgi:hypothetical protein
MDNWTMAKRKLGKGNVGKRKLENGDMGKCVLLPSGVTI